MAAAISSSVAKVTRRPSISTVRTPTKARGEQRVTLRDQFFESHIIDEARNYGAASNLLSRQR
jgi:hypothetical protein